MVSSFFLLHVFRLILVHDFRFIRSFSIWVTDFRLGFRGFALYFSKLVFVFQLRLEEEKRRGTNEGGGQPDEGEQKKKEEEEDVKQEH